ncbi:MAG: preprotein translocase subunit SecG [Clostridia bacterium]|nr:preprotein translocase subunit SecG [Clostridia bacterium]
METLQTILNILLVVVAIVLVVVVLMQKSKSGGLGGAFGGDTQSFGSRGKAASKEAKLQNITIASAVIIAVISIVMMIVA